MFYGEHKTPKTGYNYDDLGNKFPKTLCFIPKTECEGYEAEAAPGEAAEELREAAQGPTVLKQASPHHAPDKPDAPITPDAAGAPDCGQNHPERAQAALRLEMDLARDLGGFFSNPLGFVLYAFDWAAGEGPDEWQADILRQIGEGALKPAEAVRVAVASGHGIGKSTLAAWIILWAMSTRPHLAGVVTANTASQLTGKTWRELSVWHKRLINRHWFRWTATKFYQVDNPETWFVSAIPWSKDRPEAFAGLHAKHVLMLFDEASAIDAAIWETAEGAMTTPGAIWCCFGNPTRGSGKFFECFHRMRHRWATRQVDSRQAKMANQSQINQWLDDYGEDSDFVRVRVRGVFPRSGSNQLIPQGLVDEARKRGKPHADSYDFAPKVMGVDVARFGDDQSVITFRQGLCLYRPQLKFRGLDLMTLAGRVAEEIKAERPDAVFVDMGGMGAGVLDRLRQLGFYEVMGVDFGAASGSVEYFNKRAEMWGGVREWLKSGAWLPDDPALAADLTGPEYGFSGDKGQIMLEKKADMKKRGLASPDCGDSLALTFAYPVTKKSIGLVGQAPTAHTAWSPFA